MGKQKSNEQPDEPRVGVYVCHCGGNISDVIDVASVVRASQRGKKVRVAKDFAFMCSDPGQKLIIDDILQNGINRVVVSACSPALHEQTFRKALERAGLNPYLYEHVNIREQCSWVHKKNPAEATAKASRLTMAGINKIALQDPLEAIRVNAERHAVVIGGGVAGMRAALALTRQGIGVTLLEQSGRVGGRTAGLPSVYPSGKSGGETIASLVQDVRSEAGISCIVNATVEQIDGYVGNFNVSVRAGKALVEIRAGAIVMATGFDSYQPSEGEFGFGKSPSVITLPDFIEILGQVAPDAKTLLIGGRPVKSAAFVHCVGSRQTQAFSPEKRPNEYCSRICCTTAMHAINNVSKRFPDIQVYDVYRDIRTYGRGHEDLYDQASRHGTMFFRSTEDTPIEVATAASGGATLTVSDTLTWGEELKIDADLVVLVTGMVPRDISSIIKMLKLPVGTDGFLQEVHPKLRPVELANSGIFVAGTCQGPMDIGESCAAAEAVASKVAILLAKPTIQLDPFVARVNAERCDGCAVCIADCSYDGALVVEETDGVKLAVVNPALCSGCGACVAVCPKRAIDIAGWSLDQFDAMIDAICEEPVLV